MAGRLLLRACATTLRLRSSAVAGPLRRTAATEGGESRAFFGEDPETVRSRCCRERSCQMSQLEEFG